MVSKIADMSVPIKSSKKTKDRNRKQSEEKLRASQKFTRSIIDSSLDMICATDKNARIMEFNKAALQSFGYKPDEILGKSPRVLYANMKEALAINDQLISSGGYTGEVTYKRKNGEEFIAYLSASVLKDEKENIVGTMSISRDITERKKVEDTLRVSEERYRNLIETMNEGLLQVDNEDKIVFVNKRFCEMIGSPQDELIGKYAYKQLLPQYSRTGKEIKKIIALRKKGISSQYETQVSTKSGEFKWFIIDGSPIYDTNGKVVGSIGVHTDITERKKAEETLRMSEEKYRTIYNYANIGICRVNLDGKFINVNQQFCKIMGYSEEELHKMKFMDLTHPDDLKKSIKFKSALLRGKQSRNSMEKKYVHKNGSIIYAKLTVTLVRDQNGDPDYFVAVTQDITEKKKAEELLKGSLQEKEILLREIHHRVKNNLQIISSMLSLQSSYINDKNTINILKESQDRIKSMAFIHESLYQTKDFSSINISEYIENLSKNLVHSFGTQYNFVSLKLDTDNIYLNLDTAIPCGLIINELVSNSLKYAFPDNHKGEIKITLKQKHTRLILTIADNGIGFPYGLNFKKTESLGLQLVNTLVDQVNGNIKMTNKKGTKFIITLAAKNKTTK